MFETDYEAIEWAAEAEEEEKRMTNIYLNELLGEYWVEYATTEEMLEIINISYELCPEDSMKFYGLENVRKDIDKWIKADIPLSAIVWDLWRRHAECNNLL